MVVTVSTSFSSLAAFLWQQNLRFVLVSVWITGPNSAGGDEWFLSCFLAQQVPRDYSFPRQDGESSPQPALFSSELLSKTWTQGNRWLWSCGWQTRFPYYLFFFLLSRPVFLPLTCRNNAGCVTVTSESEYKRLRQILSLEQPADIYSHHIRSVT